MPYPASQQLLVDALQKANRVALQLKTDAQNRVTTMSAQPVTGGYVLSVLGRAVEAIATFDEVSALPGIAPYAQEQLNDGTLDVAAEFAAMRAAAVGVRDWIIANLPQGSGYLEVRSLDAGGNIVERTFAPAQTAGLRTELNALIATIS